MLIRQTAQYLPAQLLGPLAQLVAIVLWTHWLAPPAFGLFTLAVALQEAVYLLLLSFWSYYVLRFLPGADGGQRARMDVVESWMLLSNLVLQPVVVLLSMRMVEGHWPPVPMFLVVLAFTFSRSYCSHLAERARSSAAIVRYTLLQVVGPIGGLLIGVAWAQVQTIGAREVLLSYVLAQAVSLVCAAFGARVPPALRPLDRPTLRHALGYGLPLAVSGLVAWVPGNGIRFVVEHAMGMAAVGVFSVGWTLGQRASAFAAMLVTAAAFPLVLKLEAEGRMREAMAQLALNGALLWGVLLPAVVGLVVLTPALTRLAVSPPYVTVTLTVLPLAALAGLVKNLRSHFANQAFLLAQKTGWTLALDVVETSLFLLGVGAGLRAFGLAGAAWGALLAVTVGALAAFALAVLRLGMPLPVAHLLRVAFATLCMAAAVYAMPTLPGWGGLLLATLAGVLVYLTALAALYPRALLTLRARRT